MSILAQALHLPHCDGIDGVVALQCEGVTCIGSPWWQEGSLVKAWLRLLSESQGSRLCLFYWAVPYWQWEL